MNYSKMKISYLQKECDKCSIKYLKKDTKTILINKLEINNAKKYIKLSERSFKYFFSKGFIFPASIKLGDSKAEFEDKLLQNIPDYITIIEKDFFPNPKDIFLEIENNLEIEKIENGLYIYNGILPLSKIKSIFINNKEVFESILNSNWDTTAIPKKIIFNENINLEKVDLNIINIKKNNEKLEELKNKIQEENRKLGGTQLLKLINENIYNDFILKKEVESLEFVYNYINNKNINNNYNNFLLVNFIKEEIIENSNFEGKESLNKFNNFFIHTITQLKGKNLLEKDDIEELRKKAKNIKSFINKEINIIKLIDSLDENKDYGIIIYLFLYKYGKIEEFASFIELGLNKINFIKIKLLLVYIYGELVGYSSLYVQKEIGMGKNIKFKFDITNEYDIDIYENKVDENKIKYRKANNGIEVSLNEYYGNSDIVINKKKYLIKREDIVGYLKLEKTKKCLEDEVTLVKNKFNELENNNNKLKKELENLEKENRELKEQNKIVNAFIEKYNISKKINNEINGGTNGNSQLQIG